MKVCQSTIGLTFSSSAKFDYVQFITFVHIFQLYLHTSLPIVGLYCLLCIRNPTLDSFQQLESELTKSQRQSSEHLAQAKQKETEGKVCTVMLCVCVCVCVCVCALPVLMYMECVICCRS